MYINLNIFKSNILFHFLNLINFIILKILKIIIMIDKTSTN